MTNLSITLDDLTGVRVLKNQHKSQKWFAANVSLITARYAKNFIDNND